MIDLLFFRLLCTTCSRGTSIKKSTKILMVRNANSWQNFTLGSSHYSQNKTIVSIRFFVEIFSNDSIRIQSWNRSSLLLIHIDGFYIKYILQWTCWNRAPTGNTALLFVRVSERSASEWPFCPIDLVIISLLRLFDTFCGWSMNAFNRFRIFTKIWSPLTNFEVLRPKIVCRN